MIEKVALNAANHTVYKLNGTPVRVKFLNYLSSGIKILRSDEQAIAAPDCSITNGDVLVRGSTKLIVAHAYQDFFKGTAIRLNLIMVTADNTVTISRPTVTKSVQGGITGHTETVLYSSVPCKIGNLTAFDNVKLDESLLRFVVLIPSTCIIQMGDMLKFSSKYAPAKVEGIKRDSPGLLELIFDKEPRWTSV